MGNSKMKTQEIWKQHSEYHNYEISNLGKIRHIKTKRERHLRLYGGYPRIVLRGNQGKQRLRPLHQLVLETFIGQRPKGFDGCHNDGNKLNNCISNLRWDTRKSNANDTIQQGRYIPMVGNTNGKSKLMTLDIIAILEYRKKGYSDRKIGRLFGISYHHARDIFMGVNWKCVHKYL
jgi:hypothetical protein